MGTALQMEKPVVIGGWERRAAGQIPLRSLFTADISKEDAIAAGKAAVEDKLTGTVVKEIYVPKKIINIVQK